MTTYLQDLGKFLYDRRIKLNYTQNYLASLLNVSNQAIYKYEHGLSSPDFAILGKYADILNIKIDDLLNLNLDFIEYKNEDILDFDTDKFSNNLKILRVKNNLTLSKLQELINVKYQTISKWEKGESLPSIQQFISLAKVYDQPLYNIYYGIEPSANSSTDNTPKVESTPPKSIKRMIIPWVITLVLLLLFAANIIITSTIIKNYQKQLDDQEELLNRNQDNSNNNQNNNNSINQNNNNDLSSSNLNNLNENNNTNDNNDNSTINSNGTIDGQDSNTTNTIDSNGTDIDDENSNVPNTITYTVNYYQENISDDNYTLYETKTYQTISGTIIIALVNNYNGFTSPNEKSVVINEETTSIDYYYDREIYNISFNTNGGNEIENIPLKYGSNIEINIIPTKNDSSFYGWYLDSELSNKLYNNTINNITKDIVVYACWNDSIKNGLYEYIVNDDYITITGLKDGNVFHIPNIIENLPVRKIDITKSDINPIYIELPNTIQEITNFNFKSNNVIRDIYINGSLQEWMNINLSSSIFNNAGGSFYYKSDDNYIELRDNLIIPSSIDKIKEYTFSNFKNIKTVTMGEFDGIIESYAFYNCSSLTTINLSNSLDEIEMHAFEECVALNKINISNLELWFDIPFTCSIDGSNNPLMYAHNLYLNDVLLTEITIPESVTTINPNIFYGSESIIKIIVPNTVNRISKGAFSGLLNLESITLPFIGESMAPIDSDCIYPLGFIFGDIEYCNSTNRDQTYKCPESIIDENYTKWYYFPCMLTEVILTDSTFIPDGAFMNCEFLEVITLPDNITSIGKKAFFGCYRITEISLPNKLTSIGEYAFSYCEILTTINLSNNITSIGAHAFEGCTNLTTINIPKNITTISNNTFRNCFSLKEITIPNKVTSIDTEAFYQTGLESIIIPSKVLAIHERAFGECTSLKTITFSYGLEMIDGEAFSGCRMLESINLPESVIFTGWRAFYECRSLKSVHLPSNLEKLGNESFAYCISLTSINIPGSAIHLQAYAFSYCSSLTSVTINEGITYIEDGAFRYCTALKEIVLPDSVEYVGGYAFYYCTSLETVYMSTSTKSINERSFAYCSLLKNIYYNNGYRNWGRITKELFWDMSSGEYKIYCSDRTLDKE